MAQFDPSIISQIPDMGPNPVKAKADAYKLSDLMDTNTLNQMKLSELKQQEGDQQKRKQILKDNPAVTDEDATKVAEKLTQAGLPDESMRYIKDRQAIKGGALDIQFKALEVKEKQQEAIVGAMDVVTRQVNAYKQANPNATDAMMDAKTQELIVPAMDQLAKARPDLVPQIDQYKKSEGAFTFQGLMSAEGKAQSGQKLLAEQRAELKANRDDRAQNTRDIAEANREADTRRRQQAEDFKEAQVKKKEEENDKADDATAHLIATYRFRPPTGIGSRSPEARVLMEKAQKENPGYDSTKYDEKRKAVLDFGTGKQGDNVRALNNAISHMDTMDSLAKALDNGQVTQVNRWKQVWADQTGHPAPGNFDAAKQIVTEEVGKAVLPSGGVGAERLEILANANRAKAYPELLGVMKTWKKLLSGQMNDLKLQYRNATGLDNFDEMMTPQALRELQEQGPPPEMGKDAPASKAGDYDPKKPGSGIW